MRVKVRRIGNSKGMIIPIEILREWGVDVGDEVDISGTMITPLREVSKHELLDELRRRIALEVLSLYGLDEIRKKSLSNLSKWRSQGVWGKHYEIWLEVVHDDDKLRRIMIGADDFSVQMRQSSPYVGLLPQERVLKLKQEIFRETEPG